MQIEQLTNQLNQLDKGDHYDRIKAELSVIEYEHQMLNQHPWLFYEGRHKQIKFCATFDPFVPFTVVKFHR